MRLSTMALMASIIIGASALSGDTRCSRGMCVSAYVNGTGIVTYKLNIERSSIGWLAMGYGTGMVGSPMVILYTNSSGNTIVSQRLASGHSEPPVDSNPPRKATPYDALKSLGTNNQYSLAFTIPANTDTIQSIIWAYSSIPPTSSGDLVQQHDDSGTMSLNLLNSLDNAGGYPNNNPTPSVSSNPLTFPQRLIAAHGIIMSIVFFFILPFGVLLARLGRTYLGSWFVGHSFLQFCVSFPLVVSGFVLASVEVSYRGIDHFSTTHKKTGLAIFILYIAQVSLGIIIHFFKPTPSQYPQHPAIRRPIQNYSHAILGLTILGLSFWQIRTGFDTEWPKTQDMSQFDSPLYSFWAAWTAILGALYILGLGLLPRQFSLERQSQRAQSASESGGSELRRSEKGST